MDEAQHRAPKPGSIGIRRRTFLGWSSWAVGVVPGSAALSLVACGGSDSSPPPPPSSLSNDPVVIDNPVNLSISIQARQVQWVAGKSPAQANAWVFVADATTPATGVLGNHLGPFINVRRNSALTVTWTNTIGASTQTPARLADPPINVPLDLGMCGRVVNQSPVGLSVHMHGARVQADADGWPLTPVGFANNPYGFPLSHQDLYPNAQRGAMLWYHDHGMDRVGRHVHAGLAGPYCIRDDADDAILALIGGRSQELLFVISDRVLTADQTGIDYDAGIPHEFSLSIVGSDDAVGRPEFLGNEVFINGHPAPDLTLARAAWRLRLLDLSNARTYAVALCDPDAIAAGAGPSLVHVVHSRHRCRRRPDRSVLFAGRHRCPRHRSGAASRCRDRPVGRAGVGAAAAPRQHLAALSAGRQCADAGSDLHDL